MTTFHHLKPYLPVITSSYWMIFILRLTEFTALTLVFGWNSSWLGFEVLGLFYDFALISAFLLLLFPVFFLLHKLNKSISYLVSGIFMFIVTVCHFLILSYFIHQLIPLDVFLYQHPFEEIYFTITTSNVWLLPALSLIAILGIVPCLILWRIVKQKKHKLSTVNAFSLLIIGAFISAFILLIPQSKKNHFIQNKSGYFWFNSLQFIFSNHLNFDDLNPMNISYFQDQYPHKEFVSNTYPLLHEVKNEDGLQPYLNDFDSVPNLVLVIVEGLSDEYIHEYHGVQMMPFLNSLKDSSLYWEKCFTLGERSFAAVPSLLGGLPYGDLGFTLLNNYPRHHTLVNLLDANDYHTSFFYGQGAWFHNKRNFFNYNYVDWILDKDSFDEKHHKIIVGENDYFWGYSDMDLFDQYFKAMDSLPKSPYFNTFFTGSSHPPYYIPNEEQYVKRLDHEISQENKAFINAYGTYMKTIMFVDEALQDFFEEYKQRKDYENTLFIITGDHPMSELPRINELTKYHVPLIIYSPKLKKTHKFNHSVSHLDFSNTMLNYLKNYNLNLPKNSASLGFNLFNTDKSTTRRYAFMDGNRGMYEYYADGYYLRKNQLFKVNADLSIQEINNDSLKNDLQKALDNFKTINYRTSFDNKVLSKEEYTQGLNKEILYKKLDSSFIKSKDEYINMVPSSLIENKDFRVELNFDFIKNIDNGLMVFEMKDASDSIVFWQSTSLKEAKEYQVHYHFEKNKKLGSELFFSIYLWNQEKEEIELKNMDILIQ